MAKYTYYICSYIYIIESEYIEYQKFLFRYLTIKKNIHRISSDAPLQSHPWDSIPLMPLASFLAFVHEVTGEFVVCLKVSSELGKIFYV